MTFFAVLPKDKWMIGWHFKMILTRAVILWCSPHSSFIVPFEYFHREHILSQGWNYHPLPGALKWSSNLALCLFSSYMYLEFRFCSSHKNWNPITKGAHYCQLLFLKLIVSFDFVFLLIALVQITILCVQ